MSVRRQLNRRTALLATTILSVVGGVGLSVPALAAAAQPAQVAQAEPIEEVVITGSRLQVSGFQTPTPVTVLGESELEQRAATTIADVVNQLPAMRQTVTNTQTQRGNGNGGRNGVDLRGLGTARTLVLVNGRRVIGTDVDLNQVPTALVDRVEVVTGGASAAYGSDAVSGVVNFILREHMDGVQGSVQYGQSFRNDNKEPGFSISGGSSFHDGRGEFIVGGDYSDNKGMGTIYSRDWFSKDLVGLIAYPTTNRGTLPAQGLVSQVTYSTQAAGSVILSGPLKGTAFGPGGVPYQFQYGTIYSNLMVGGANPKANPFGNWWVEAPHRRWASLGRISYDVTENVNVFVELEYGHNEQDGLSSFHQNTGLIVPNTNPFIPTSVAAQMQANKLTSITVGRVETSLGGYQLFNQETGTQATFGAKGTVFDDWKWDVSAAHGIRKTDAKVYTNILEGNYLAATYVVTGTDGKPACGPLATNPNMTAARAAQVTPGCVPFNIFGPNENTQAAIDYIKYTSNTSTQQRLDVFAANIAGEPFTTWAGPVSVAAGVEHRYTDNVGVADTISHAFTSSASLSNNGTDTAKQKLTVTEGYFETGIPLAKGKHLMEALDANAAIRFTDYSTSGSVTTWKIGLNYVPTDDYRLRLTRSRDIRAPSLANLFTNSAGLGITASFFNPVTGRTGPLYTQTGGNPNLVPEKADTWTGGIIVTPEWFHGFRASIDYFNINVKGEIATVTAANIATRCAQGLQEYCALMGTNPLTGDLLIRSVPANLQSLKTSGFDFEFAYEFPFDQWNLPGRLTARMLATHVKNLTTVEAGISTNRAGSGVGGGLPEWSGSANLSYAINGLTSNLQFRFFNSLLADATLVEPRQAGYNSTLPNSINLNVYPGYMYVDLAEQYDLIKEGTTSVQLFLTVNNLLDKAPPYAAIIAFINGGDPYDLIGRTFKAGVRFKY